MSAARRSAARIVAPVAWVVVADHTRARLFTARGPTTALTEREDLLNPAGRLHEGQLVSDRTGHLTRSTRRGGNAVRTHESAREHNAEAFALSICARLRAVRAAGAVSRIHVVAERDFLGRLRRQMDRATRRLVVSELGKSLARRRPSEIRASLPARL